jgi:hypothetical protein
MMYLYDVTTSSAEPNSSNPFSISGIASLSSPSSISSGSDSDTSLSVTPSEFVEECLEAVQEEIHKLREKITTT